MSTSLIVSIVVNCVPLPVVLYTGKILFLDSSEYSLSEEFTFTSEASTRTGSTNCSSCGLISGRGSCFRVVSGILVATTETSLGVSSLSFMYFSITSCLPNAFSAAYKPASFWLWPSPVPITSSPIMQSTINETSKPLPTLVVTYFGGLAADPIRLYSFPLEFRSTESSYKLPVRPDKRGRISR
ncbi:hypothetical protein OGAPHI_005525 [Ogataea philodendri]|uniref:Uncharacterized protein n=1 Tax=Ogataea philodendri TaxID=1378263 RepID=A0A9P8NZS8_9ASCO|nr:uncharacterized protein OGAPHI_005525 [Ogataea philodendri]KAH3662276.1 hypothetical protein OGAPHI_005525 [Ogataea philodendri]